MPFLASYGGYQHQFEQNQRFSDLVLLTIRVWYRCQLRIMPGRTNRAICFLQKHARCPPRAFRAANMAVSCPCAPAPPSRIHLDAKTGGTWCTLHGVHGARYKEGVFCFIPMAFDADTQSLGNNRNHLILSRDKIVSCRIPKPPFQGPLVLFPPVQKAPPEGFQNARTSSPRSPVPVRTFAV